MFFFFFFFLMCILYSTSTGILPSATLNPPGVAANSLLSYSFIVCLRVYVYCFFVYCACLYVHRVSVFCACVLFSCLCVCYTSAMGGISNRDPDEHASFCVMVRNDQDTASLEETAYNQD